MVSTNGSVNSALPASWSVQPQMDGRGIVIVAPPRVVSAPLCAAIERQFPWLQVCTVDSMTTLVHAYREPIQLLMVDVSLADQLDQHWEELVVLYPALKLAFISDTQVDSLTSLYRLKAGPVRGVLSLDVKLDVFLASLNIVLNGGTYFSVPSHAPSRHYPNAEIDSGWARSQGSGSQTSPLSKLTSRERQILSHIARGKQNKIIAAVLGLSEHTVKIHIHNLIAKLRVHNRTEAAAIYLREER